MLFINIDVSELQDLMDLGGVAESEMAAAARDLAAATRGKIVELAQERLHTRRSQYIDALSMFQMDENTFVVNLDASARWIEDGMQEHNMLDDLLKSKSAKRAKDGSMYVVVPFQLNKPKQQLTPAQQSLIATVKKEMAKVGATPNKLEMGADGKPKLGLVRSLDITKGPMSTPSKPIGRGIGTTAVGPTGVPLLKGVRVYQKEMKDKDGNTKTGRFVMTFRVASSKHKSGPPPSTMTGAWRKKMGDKLAPGNSQARWDHPGLPAMNLMDEGLKWALDQWESKIAPSILAKIVAKIS